jgi:protein-S-isoprenylcysteine O-methyltransferase Ste14
MFVFRTVLIGTIVLLLSLIVGPWLALQFDASFPVLQFGWLRGVGIALIALGVPLAVYCAAVLMIPGGTRPAPYDAGGTFTIAGPYSYVRNPFMLGVILALWGEALLLSRVVMIAYAFILTWVIHVWVVFYEEPSLAESLGDEYRAYKAVVPRWIPQLRKYEPALSREK